MNLLSSALVSDHALLRAGFLDDQVYATYKAFVTVLGSHLGQRLKGRQMVSKRDLERAYSCADALQCALNVLIHQLGVEVDSCLQSGSCRAVPPESELRAVAISAYQRWEGFREAYGGPVDEVCALSRREKLSRVGNPYARLEPQLDSCSTLGTFFDGHFPGWEYLNACLRLFGPSDIECGPIEADTWHGLVGKLGRTVLHSLGVESGTDAALGVLKVGGAAGLRLTWDVEEFEHRLRQEWMDAVDWLKSRLPSGILLPDDFEFDPLAPPKLSKELVTLDQYARDIGLTRKTLWNAKGLPAPALPRHGRQPAVYDAADLDAWLREKKPYHYALKCSKSQ